MLGDEFLQACPHVVEGPRGRPDGVVVESLDQRRAEFGVLGIHRLHHRQPALGQVHQNGSTVGRMRLAPRQTRGVEGVDEGRDVAGRDAELFRQVDLRRRPAVEQDPHEVRPGDGESAAVELALLIGLEHTRDGEEGVEYVRSGHSEHSTLSPESVDPGLLSWDPVPKIHATLGKVSAMAISARATKAMAAVDVVTAFFAKMQSTADDPGALDFTFGNPHEFALPGLTDALRAQIEPQSVDWFAYKTSEPAAQQTVAGALRAELGLPFEPDDIAMTQGAFGAISLALGLLTDVGDEVVIPVPGWFCYEPMLHAADLVPVRAPLAPDTFDLDADAIGRAITSRTRIVIVNSPANPTGRVYPAATWEALAEVLESASHRNGRRIWLLSDEPYRRIRFDGVEFASPAAAYPWTVIDYSYGKVLLAPGQRLGYLALSPLIPQEERAALRGALFPIGLAIGWGFPDAVMQYSVPALENVSIDLAELTRKRDRLCSALVAAGVEVTRPEGTFYLWGRAPGGDAVTFCDALAARGIHLMPGTLFDQPGHFRISLTQTMDVIERALPDLLAVSADLGGRAS